MNKINISQTDEFYKTRRRLAELTQKWGCSELEKIKLLTEIVCDKVLESKDTILSANDKQRLINQATAMYLECWLENDKESTQTIYSFASIKFLSRSKQKQHTSIANALTVKLYQRYEIKFRDMMLLRDEQAKFENMKTKSLPQKGQHRCYYDFITLYTIYMMSETNWLTIYDLLTGKKELLAITNKKGSNEPLYDACNFYKLFFDYVSNQTNKKEEKKEKEKEYVLASMAANKIEHAFRFSLFIKIAQYAQYNGIDTEQVDISKHPFWTRYTEPISVLGSISEIPIEAIDILNYESLIPYAFCASNDTEIEIKKQRLWRETLTTVLRIIVNIKPPSEQPAWGDSIFEKAANFFNREFNIIEALKPAQIDKDGIDDFCNKLRNIYNSLNTEDMPLYRMREELQKFRKQRNQKKV